MTWKKAKEFKKKGNMERFANNRICYNTGDRIYSQVKEPALDLSVCTQ